MQQRRQHRISLYRPLRNEPISLDSIRGKSDWRGECAFTTAHTDLGLGIDPCASHFTSEINDPVLFTTVDGDATLAASPGAAGTNSLVVYTDTNGNATVWVSYTHLRAHETGRK